VVRGASVGSDDECETDLDRGLINSGPELWGNGERPLCAWVNRVVEGKRAGGWWLVAGVEFAAMDRTRPAHRPPLTVNDPEIHAKFGSKFTIRRTRLAIGRVSGLSCAHTRDTLRVTPIRELTAESENSPLL
jgi:hypothetical protein